MNAGHLSFLVLLCLILGCGPSEQKEETKDLKVLAEELANKFIITDGHVDLPYRLRVKNFRLEKEYLGIPISTDEGDFDYERAKAGGLDAPFMSIYIPSRYQQTGGAKALADTLINMVQGIAKAHPDKFAMAYSPEDIKKNFEAGKLSLPMGMENGAPVGDDLANLSYFYNRGIRYITLTHAKDNQICDSSYDKARTWNGLSPFGREVVREMNRLGIMVDISHVSDSAFYQVMELTQTPAIASHSSCRYFTPDFERNMSDDMIRALAKNGGVIQINFGSTFIDAAAIAHSHEKRKKLQKMLDEAGLKAGDEEAKELIKKFQDENPTLFSDVQKVADHIDHVVALVGVDHVGFGSDFDGVGDTLPTGLKDVSDYPNLIHELLKRGYTEEDIEKICYQNVFRVWSQVEDIAGKLQEQSTTAS